MRIFYHTTPSENLLHLSGLAKCLGISTEFFNVRLHNSLVSALKETTKAGDDGVVLDVATLNEKCQREDLREVVAYLGNHHAAVLLLTTTVDQCGNGLLQGLSNGIVQNSEPVDHATSVFFPGESSRLSRELSSYSYSRKPKQAIGLNICPNTEIEVIMKLGQMPSFAHMQVGAANIFVWSTPRVFDVTRPLKAEKEFEDAVEEYVPPIIFLKFTYGERCWHNPNIDAGIVIDDPLLEKKYGFIDFPRLLESARQHGYHVTLAFIPWNHRRSRVKKAKMFRNYSDCFSICAHGCDHTKSEFGSADYDDLLNRNFVARQRMEQHRERTGLANQPLMVCPQEQYSLEAMRAFADSRQFIGLVCTACMPRNLATPGICGADLLLPAQDSFFGFPVFKRHYGGDMSVFAMALFLGKPAILVAHHEFFRDGPNGTEAFASALLKLRPDMNWTSLTEIASRTHLRRHRSEGRLEVRFFTDDFTLEHEGETSIEYRLIRRIPATTLVRRVTVNNLETSFVHEDGLLIFKIQADALQVYQIQVWVTPVRPTKSYSTGVKYRASVALRRHLSEFRDNVIARNGFALRAARLLAKKLKQTSG